jgi:hypothetical protein
MDDWCLAVIQRKFKERNGIKQIPIKKMNFPTSVKLCSQKFNSRQALVAHICNPSYSGGRDQEDHGSKPVWANSLWDYILKIHITKKGLVEWLKIQALSANPTITKKKKNSWWNTDPNVTSKTLKIFRRKEKRKFWWLKLGKDFWHMTTKTLSIRNQVINLSTFKAAVLQKMREKSKPQYI